MEHTPGPWKRHAYFEAVTGPNGEFICLTVKPGMTPKPYTEANSKLIAAAPDLANNLMSAYGYLLANMPSEHRNTISGQFMLATFRDTLAKAYGVSEQEIEDKAKGNG